MEHERESTTVDFRVIIGAAAIECDNCGAESHIFHAVPVDLRGDYVESDYPGPWRAAPVCRGCADAYAIAGVKGLELRLRVLTEPVVIAAVRSSQRAGKRQPRALTLA